MSVKPSLEMYPSVFGTSLLVSQKPIDETGNFTFTCATARDRIDSLGVSEEVAVNIPRLDYRKEYVVPTDDSFYALDGVDDKITITNAVDCGADFFIECKVFFDSTITDVSLIGNLGGGAEMAVRYQKSANIMHLAAKDGATYYTFSASSFQDVTNRIVNLAYEKVGTTYNIYVDNVLEATTTVSSSTAATLDIKFIGTRVSNDFFINGKLFYLRGYNFVPTTAERLDLFNGVAISNEYVGANGFGFTAGAFSVGKRFRILTSGSTDFTLIGAADSNVGTEFTATGVGTGTGTATSIGNVLDLSVGKSTGFFYDRNHEVVATVTSATLTESTDFGSNAHGLEVCPVYLSEPGFTNHFLNSRVPVTQTITGLSIGTVYTINAKGTGIITVDETGGNGVGGTITEVYPLTYTATATSIVITLVAGEAFDWVQLSDTLGAVNHVETAGSTVTKVKDELTNAGVAATFDSISGVLEVEMSALFNDETVGNGGVFLNFGLANRVSISYVSTLNTIFFTVVIGNVSIYAHNELVTDITVSKIMKLKYKALDYGVKIDGTEVDSQASGIGFVAGILANIDLNLGSNEFKGRLGFIKTHSGIDNY